VNGNSNRDPSRVPVALAVTAVLALLAFAGTVSNQACAQESGPPTVAPLANQDAAPTAQVPAAADSTAVSTQSGPATSWRGYLLWGLFALFAPLGSVVALVFAFRFYKWVKRQDPGSAEMQEIADHVRVGAMTYLKRQYSVIGIFVVLLVGVLVWLAFSLGLQHKLVPFAFLSGAFFSGLAGYLGMRTATMASNRTTQGATKSLNAALQVAFKGGAVLGLTVVGLGLLDIALWFVVCRAILGMELLETTVTMLNFGMGASTMALFARVGGGIFTKAADVGADLVGKIEAGIPEDDPRNPATIADNVGDNVGDVAGMGADLYESYCGSILATATLGVAAGYGMAGVVLPMVVAGVGVLLSILGIYMVRAKKDAGQKTLLKALGRGINASSWGIAILSLGAVLVVLNVCGGVELARAFGVWGSVIVGLLVGIGIGKSTEHYTSADSAPTRKIAEQSETGAATVIISGIAVGMRSTAIPVLLVGSGILLSFGLAGGFDDVSRGLFGVGFAAVGMLSTLGITLATDAYGPIADNAGGNAEMTGQPPEVRERTDALDSLGNTTAATGKGFAIGSAALTGMALIAAYIEEVRIGMERVIDKAASAGLDAFVWAGTALTTEAVHGWKMSDFMDFFRVNLMNPRVLVGLFIGAALAFLFCSLTMQAVGRAASRMVEEVRRQFREIPGIMEGTGTPDYARCVSISTSGAQREMVLPSLLAVIAPILVGLALGVGGVIGLLAGGLTTGFVLAVMMANAGGAWDNAKKYIEAGNLGGKGSDNHKATVVGDTVGDPFKDTSGPSLNILIKLMCMVSIVFSGLTVAMYPRFAGWVTELFAFFGS